MSMQLAELMPDRTITCVPACPEVGPASATTRRTPALTAFGEKDGQQTKQLLAKLPAERKQGARWPVAAQRGPQARVRAGQQPVVRLPRRRDRPARREAVTGRGQVTSRA
jgi:hypothetical protein